MNKVKRQNANSYIVVCVHIPDICVIVHERERERECVCVCM